ncbi:MAG: hypothetical protein WCS88_03040 [Patescibacteria group bacterium]|jgi:hypothetical protein
MRTRNFSFLAMAFVAIMLTVVSTQAKVVLTPTTVDSVGVERVGDSTLLKVPATIEVYDSLFVDSVNTYRINDLVEAIKQVDSTFDGSEAAVKARITQREARAKAEADSLAAAEAAELKKLHKQWSKEVKPLSYDSVWVWALIPDNDTAYMKAEWLAERYSLTLSQADIYNLDSKEIIEELKAQLRQRQKINATVDTRIAKSIAGLQSQLNALSDTLSQTRAGVELAYKLADEANCKAEANTAEISRLWSVWEALEVQDSVSTVPNPETTTPPPAPDSSNASLVKNDGK